MASLIPLINDLLPMIIPSSASITKASTLRASDATLQPGSANEADAVVSKSDKLCASVLTLNAHATSAIRHHGEQGQNQTPSHLPHLQRWKPLTAPQQRCVSNVCQDTIVYMASGTGVLLVSPGAGQDVKRHEMSTGDFAFIPSWTEHQMLNESDQDTVWVITRSGSQPVKVGLTDWGGDEAK
ncbi:uncharacterized protein ColSpa_01586 [Colletotrichum spaethianum]|uniref:Cupin type-2 domain-containing protein n=1 Tax=Colletotrichum spaethianum TaxID=700344 RepID=A0AA37NWJ1_9PEZI|nr:uncharacterized protein ColSpa_01586 [Colletotrichum spaethianum]GKT41405.1 hypothetical protein ColSpa_01586 [Colletotrichum spaethianum]